MLHTDKIHELFPDADERQVSAMEMFINGIIDSKIKLIELNPDAINIVTIDTGMRPYTKATAYLEMIANRFREVHPHMECVFVGKSDQCTNTTEVCELPKTPCIVKIPIGFMSPEMTNMYMAKFSVFEDNLRNAGYLVKFVPNRESGSVDIK